MYLPVNSSGTEDVFVVEIRLKGDPLEYGFELIEDYLFPVELIHMSLGLDDESFKFVATGCSAFVFP